MKRIKSIYDVRQLLLTYNTVIYTRDTVADLLLMEEELVTLHQMGLIDNERYAEARILLRAERRKQEGKED